jgi:hypothetical protein
LTSQWNLFVREPSGCHAGRLGPTAEQIMSWQFDPVHL